MDRMESSEREQLERAKEALEAQRAVLGDAVVDAALGPLCARLATLQARALPLEQQRKQVTVLFADVAGFTAMLERMDAEEATELLNAAWERLDGVITAHGGRIDKHIGDSVMALWGATAAREDDPERAIRAALAMQAALADLRQERGTPLAMRIALHTGPVLLGEVGLTREFTAMGDTVNLAARLEHEAPVGGVLISHDAYCQVRGLFDVQPQAPLTIRGKAAPVQSYIVERSKPRAFRMPTRGVEGIATRMVGRAAELRALQRAYTEALEQKETRLVTVVGEAGMGKSRLLYEFASWLELRPEPIHFFQGRAVPALQSIPGSVLRDMFAQHLDILESDGAATALFKFRAGMAGILPPERADLVGHLVGFDFSASPAVQNLLDSPDFGKLAQAYLTHYVRALTASRPLVVFLEDLHWADDRSLDIVARLVADLPRERLLVVGLTRPALFDNRPQWDGGARLALALLSAEDSSVLVDELLQRVEDIPAALRDRIVEGAEGNPFYLEELVKMLLDQGTIERGPEPLSRWRVNLERLRQVSVPPTLTGLLQARLDRLPRGERQVLECAAVVGRIFWDAAVADLLEVDRERVGAVLDLLCTSELIFRRERSAFAGTAEYLFKHALLRDVAYEMVLLRRRRSDHARVARWLEAHAAERSGEHLGLIAGHLEYAGQFEPAADYLRQAADRALGAGAFREALGFYQRALALLPAESRERAALLIRASEALLKLGEYREARQQLETGLALARQMGDDRNCAAALNQLGVIANSQGDRPQARTHLEQGLALARQANDAAKTALVLYNLGWLEMRQERLPIARARFSESQALYQGLGSRQGLARTLDGLGTLACLQGEYQEAGALYGQSLELARAAGNRLSEAITLGNLGETARLQGDYRTAQQYCRAALEIHQEIGSRVNIALMTCNLGHAAAALGDHAAARSRYHEALRLAMDIAAIPYALENLAGLAGLLAQQGEQQRALALLGLVLGHPAVYGDGRQVADQVLAGLRTQLSPEQVEAGLAGGRLLTLEAVVAEILGSGS